jgi:hypothetical protein
MVWSNVSFSSLLEVAVIVFQVCGVAALCLNRLMPTTPWADRGRIVFVIALIGLGIAGALCGRHDSEFALFAGGTMTVLLIGMTMGGGPSEDTGTVGHLARAETNLAG